MPLIPVHEEVEVAREGLGVAVVVVGAVTDAGALSGPARGVHRCIGPIAAVAVGHGALPSEDQPQALVAGLVEVDESVMGALEDEAGDRGGEPGVVPPA